MDNTPPPTPIGYEIRTRDQLANRQFNVVVDEIKTFAPLSNDIMDLREEKKAVAKARRTSHYGERLPNVRQACAVHRLVQPWHPQFLSSRVPIAIYI